MAEGGTAKDVAKSPTRVQKFGQLYHLVTDLAVQTVDASPVAWMQALHPTPALGVSPRDVSLQLLQDLDALTSPETARAGFGAPFAVRFGARVEAIVAIRQARWRFEENTDRIEVVVGSGCGVVPESDLKKEWRELFGKRSAVMRLLGLSPEKPRPLNRSLDLIEELIRHGATSFVVCAGARNAPLVAMLEMVRRESEAFSKAVRVESFFDERVASFYALGLARSENRPTVIVTTSGTAVTELHSALAEADLSGVPLVALTADRPRRLRGSGAPQSIVQTGVFSHFVAREWDLEEGDSLEGLSDVWPNSSAPARPLHINFCLDEPLFADQETEEGPSALTARAREIASLVARASQNDVHEKADWRTAADTQELANVRDQSGDFALANAALYEFLKNPGGRLAIVGRLESGQNEVAEFLRSHRIPCWVEGVSGLRGDKRLREIELRVGDMFQSQGLTQASALEHRNWCARGEVAAVLRIGSVPTTRLWRDLDDPRNATRTFSVSQLRFSGLNRGQFAHLERAQDFAAFFRGATARGPVEPREQESHWLKSDRIAFEKLNHVLNETPNSEPSLVRTLSEVISPSEKTVLYVGNSLPVRWWDHVASREAVHLVEANRGVNGIDGQISTALGLAAGRASTQEIWVLVGDLTALYDLSAPWILHRSKSLETVRTRIVVLNNSGGKIFSRVLARAPGGSGPFENRHDLGFKHWAAMWNLAYHEVSSSHGLRELADGLKKDQALHSEPHVLIELRPDARETDLFWKGLAL
ncbi:MAG: 2-succinyl-5-enolpyruvyl-6-hydroxy-3-cyclohexene-1-carboxylic-acid synthase, partial [Bdellovibrionales bacterium]|jgi:2-succinyl-5-enolpyruvyl-6-hydroxy-3-cyclohexene-1-carboxylate synthase|nr:2-succinyl-5-enolpyruvyl-6-hydroxy-3-cyclohexene-1-carboxylic-acid synthase [Bdellovibrionales bacterium]